MSDIKIDNSLKVKPVYDMLLEDEERTILRNRRLRDEMIDAFIKRNGGVPDTSRDIRVINEVLNSSDAQVLGLVDRRLKTEDNKNAEDANQILTEMLLSINSRKQEVEPVEVITTLPDHMLPEHLVPGEDSIEYQELTMDEIRK